MCLFRWFTYNVANLSQLDFQTLPHYALQFLRLHMVIVYVFGTECPLWDPEVTSRLIIYPKLSLPVEM